MFKGVAQFQAKWLIDWRNPFGKILGDLILKQVPIYNALVPCMPQANKGQLTDLTHISVTEYCAVNMPVERGITCEVAQVTGN